MIVKNKRTIISAIVALLIVLPIVYFSVSDTDIKTILLGVLSSILASIVNTDRSRHTARSNKDTLQPI